MSKVIPFSPLPFCLQSKTIQKYPDVKFKLVASLRNLKPQTSSDSVTSLNEYPVLEKDFGLDTAPTVNVITIPYVSIKLSIHATDRRLR